jgi:hypothetical protein
MKWKIFLTLCVSGFLISFPQNIIGCGPGVDAYDYYTTFFNPDISANKTLRPFYYTSYEFMYDTEDAVSTADVLAEEWKKYCGEKVNMKDAKAFVMEYGEADISNLYYFLEKNKPLSIPDTVKQNSMTNYFMQQKDFEALGYIIYAKKLEPFVNNTYDNWEAKKTSPTIDIDKKIKNGLQLYVAAKKDIFKLKYAYQVTRLALYSGKNADAAKYYDEYVAFIKTESILQPLSLALKAGALYRLGNKKEAAYLFSKAFSGADAKKVSNYISFNWAIGNNAERNDYVSLCKTNEEKANMLSLFAMRSGVSETETLSTIYNLDPANKHIETIIGREINKLESSFFTPLLNKQKGGKLFYYTWSEGSADSLLNEGKKETAALTKQLLKMGEAKNVNTALCYTSAAYCALMIRDFAKANEYLSNAKKYNSSAKVNDQWMLTNLLLTINESEKIDEQKEEKILPSLQWLQQKAIKEKTFTSTRSWSNTSQWQIFYRNIMTVALAKKYHAQGDVYKETLCVGAADKIFGEENNYNTNDFLHNDTDIKDVEKLYEIIMAKNRSNFENYLVKNNALKVDAVIDFAGTAYLRNYDYKNAIAWLQRAGASKRDTIFKSAFIELLDDREERLPTEKKTTSKLLFAQEMLATQTLLETDKPNAAKHFYKLATGLYNMTYYGHAWELVQYYRSGSDGYAIPKGATEFQKQYYGCYAAHDMYKKAFEASTDKNFKAKCLFMMAKCVQKTASERMSYSDPNYSYEKAAAMEKIFMKKFMNNKYFPQLIKEYNTTKFYEEAYNSCSYLRDFEVKKK